MRLKPGTGTKLFFKFFLLFGLLVGAIHREGDIWRMMIDIVLVASFAVSIVETIVEGIEK